MLDSNVPNLTPAYSFIGIYAIKSKSLKQIRRKIDFHLFLITIKVPETRIK